MADIENKVRRIQSVAVLPLENLSRDPEQEYFAEGTTAALSGTLAKIGALQVISRTSVVRYKKTDKSLPQIAEALGADMVVEGTILRSGDRVRISAQLIDARTDTHVWAESYDRNLRDVLALQVEVAQAIARGVQVKLTPREQAYFAQMRSIDPEAYEAYLKGRYHWNRPRPGKSGGLFQAGAGKRPGLRGGICWIGGLCQHQRFVVVCFARRGMRKSQRFGTESARDRQLPI